MAKGKGLSIYMPPNDERLAKDMSRKEECSMSDTICRAINKAAIASHENVYITEGAYVCMAFCRLDLLQAIRLETGLTLVSAVEDAMIEANGMLSAIGEARQALLEYMHPDNASFIRTWLCDGTDPNDSVHLFYDDGSEVLITRETFEASSDDIVKASKAQVMRQYKGRLADIDERMPRKRP